MTCGVCGTPNEADARFCDSCGARLSPPRPQPAQQEVYARWRAWISSNLGGNPVQIEAATGAAVAAAAARAPQEQVILAARSAWHGAAAPAPAATQSQAPRVRPRQNGAAAGGASRAGRPGWIRGRFAGFQQRNEARGRGYVTVWSFHVDRAGEPPVAFEMRGYAFEGSIANGDEVEVKATARGSKVLRISSLQNLTANATVQATKRPTPAVAALPLFLTFVTTIAAAAFSAWNFYGHHKTLGGYALAVALVALALNRLIRRISR